MLNRLCVPGKVRLSLLFKVGGGELSAEAPVLRRALAGEPKRCAGGSVIVRGHEIFFDCRAALAFTDAPRRFSGLERLLGSPEAACASRKAARDFEPSNRSGPRRITGVVSDGSAACRLAFSGRAGGDSRRLQLVKTEPTKLPPPAQAEDQRWQQQHEYRCVTRSRMAGRRHDSTIAELVPAQRSNGLGRPSSGTGRAAEIYADKSEDCSKRDRQVTAAKDKREDGDKSGKHRRHGDIEAGRQLQILVGAGAVRRRARDERSGNHFPLRRAPASIDERSSANSISGCLLSENDVRRAPLSVMFHSAA